METREKPIEWTIEPLRGSHGRADFESGEPALDNFLKRLAGQQQRKHFSRTFVAIRRGDAVKRVLGFYALSAGSLRFEQMPERLHAKLPKYPVPVARLGRLAVDLSMQGKGLGGWLLRDALLRIAAAAEELGVFAVVVDAKSEEAARFYEKYGFESLKDHPRNLILLMQTILHGLKS